MKQRINLSDNQKEIVEELFSNRENAKSIAGKIGTTQYAVLKYLKEIGKDTSNSFFKGNLADFAIEQYKNGMTQEEIAEYHGCERQAVQTLFKKFGVIVRSQLEQKKITWPINQLAFTNWSNEADLFFFFFMGFYYQMAAYHRTTKYH